MVTTVSKVDGVKQEKKVAPKKSTSQRTIQQTFNYDFSTPQDFWDSKKYWDESTKGLLLDTTRNMGIKSYAPTLLRTPTIAIAKSQQHLIDLLKYYEGDSNNLYEAHSKAFDDGYGNTTRGFGATNDESVNQKNAYEKMCKDLKHRAKQVKNFLNKKIGKGTYESLPSSIKEGLIDLCYNSGLGTFKNSPKLLNAIKNKDYSSVIGNLATVYARKNGKLEESAGLYRRSLSRAILAARDLTGFEKIQADKEIDNLYQKAQACFKRKDSNTEVLDEIYMQYKNPYYAYMHPYKGCKATKQSSSGSSLQKNAVNPKPKKDDESFVIKAWKGIKNFFLGLFGKNKDDVIEEIKAESNRGTTSFQDMQKTGSNEKLGDTQIITKNFNVVNGDTLWNLSKNYGTSVDVIQNGNDIKNANKIKTGENLKIQKIGYKIKDGDTLNSIAKKFGLTVEILKKINNIKNEDIIKKGVMIEIPGVIYTVKSGQTLSAIAKEVGIGTKELMQINNLTSDKIIPNQKLKIIYTKCMK